MIKKFIRHSYTYFILSPQEKDKLFQLKAEGLSMAKIGKKLKRHPSSIHYWINPIYKQKMIEKLKKYRQKYPFIAKELSIETKQKKVENLRIWRSKYQKLKVAN